MYAHAAELPAELEADFLVKADGTCCLVHEGAVAGCHHVTTQARVDGGCVQFHRLLLNKENRTVTKSPF